MTLAGNFTKTVFGYTGYVADINTIVVVFRGTRTLDGWIRDLRFAKPDLEFGMAPEGAKVHLGFYEAWMFLKPIMEPSFLELAQEYPGSKVLISGHSLGGAISTLAAVDLYSSHFNLKLGKWTVYTIGQPRVGNEIFSKWTNSFPFEYYRLVYENDLVPHLPPAFFGFVHINTEIWIHDEKTLKCPQEDGKESKECANSYHLYSVSAHRLIWDQFIGVGAC
jgi:predicted lipase